MMLNGFTNLCYDGKPFFAADHPINSKEDGQGLNGTFSNVINPNVTDHEPWFLLDVSKVIKPFIYQNRKDAEFKQLFDSNNDHVFMLDEYLYGVDARRAFGYTFPQLAVGCRDTLDATNFNAAYQALLKMQTDGYRPLNCKPTLLVVGPENRAAAVNLLEKQLLAKGESNVNYHIVEYLVTPYLSIEIPTCTTPTITLSNNNSASVGVTITGAAGEDIYYTLDGSTPTASSTKYTEALTLTNAGTITIKAVAMKVASHNSATASKQAVVTE